MARGFPRINFEGGGVGGGDEPEVAGGARVSSRVCRLAGRLWLGQLAFWGWLIWSGRWKCRGTSHVTEHLQVAGPTELR